MDFEKNARITEKNDMLFLGKKGYDEAIEKTCRIRHKGKDGEEDEKKTKDNGTGTCRTDAFHDAGRLHRGRRWYFCAD